MNDNYQLLLDKLNIFIRKYYKNQIYRGIIVLLFTVTVFIIISSLLEYSIRFNIIGRTIIF